MTTRVAQHRNFGQGDSGPDDTALGLSILLVDDERMLRELVRPYLELKGIKVVGESGDGLEAVSLAERLHPDIVLLDIVLPSLNGIEAAREIHKKNPGIAIIMFSAHLEADRVASSFNAGALGFVWKGAGLLELCDAIEIVAKGRPFISPAVSNIQRDSTNKSDFAGPLLGKLTRRQLQVLQLVAEGRTNKEIAAALKVSPKTVEKHRSALMEALNVHSVAGLVRFAVRVGLIG